MPPLRLEVFDTGRDTADATVVTDLNAMEEARLASYEQGYTAGWDDSVEAQRSERSQLTVDLAHNLQSLSFTYYEARSHILKGMEPLLVGLVQHLLPEVAKVSLAGIVQQALASLVQDSGDPPVKLLLNPAARDTIEALIDPTKAPPLILVEEDTLGEGQVFLQLGENETHIDLDAAILEIKTAIADFLTLSTQDIHHG
jgi:flagellar biosynthesis/type III secretory pathway protein FliH